MIPWGILHVLLQQGLRMREGPGDRGGRVVMDEADDLGGAADRHRA